MPAAALGAARFGNARETAQQPFLLTVDLGGQDIQITDEDVFSNAQEDWCRENGESAPAAPAAPAAPVPAPATRKSTLATADKELRRDVKALLKERRKPATPNASGYMSAVNPDSLSITQPAAAEIARAEKVVASITFDQSEMIRNRLMSGNTAEAVRETLERIGEVERLKDPKIMQLPKEFQPTKAEGPTCSWQTTTQSLKSHTGFSQGVARSLGLTSLAGLSRCICNGVSCSITAAP
jgi:hypothetical protein